MCCVYILYTRWKHAKAISFPTSTALGAGILIFPVALYTVYNDVTILCYIIVHAQIYLYTRWDLVVIGIVCIAVGMWYSNCVMPEETTTIYIYIIIIIILHHCSAADNLHLSFADRVEHYWFYSNKVLSKYDFIRMTFVSFFIGSNILKLNKLLEKNFE